MIVVSSKGRGKDRWSDVRVPVLSKAAHFNLKKVSGDKRKETVSMSKR